MGGPVAALGGLAMLASAIAVLLVYQLGWHLYGRKAAVLAALGLAVSPLFWTYSVIGLSYAAEAALATGIALSAWAMGRGSPRALVASAVLLGLAGGVRQSMLLILSPLWLGMAWRGFRRPGPVLAGLGLGLLTTAMWLVPMLWLTGLERYVAARPRALRVDGAGDDRARRWRTRNLIGLAEALVLGLGVLLPVLVWGLRRAPGRLLQDDDRAVFFALWVLPALAVYALVHLGQPGYLLTFLPACYLLIGRTLIELVERAQRVPLPQPVRAALAGLTLVGAFAAHVAFFTLAGPVDAPRPAAAAAGPARLTAELRALYRFRLWSHTAAGLREQEAVIGDYVAAIRREFDPRDTVLVTELGNPRSYPWFRHVMYYLPEYAAYHLRLGAMSPGYLASRELPSMAAVAERRVPLPATTHRLVWVVDEWHPDLPRPAALEVRPLPHGRSLYVLRVSGGTVDHAGYQLVR